MLRTKFEADVYTEERFFGLCMHVCRLVADLFEWLVHLRLLARDPPHEVRVEPGVQELRPVADTPLVSSQGDLVPGMELSRSNLQSFVVVGKCSTLLGQERSPAACSAVLHQGVFAWTGPFTCKDEARCDTPISSV